METTESKLYQKINQTIKDKFYSENIEITNIDIVKVKDPNNYEITVHSNDLYNVYRFSELARMFLQEYFMTSNEHYLDLAIQDFQNYL